MSTHRPASRDDLQSWICDALRSHGGEATIPDIARHIWRHHEDALRAAGDLFYTWQYDMRWAAKRLRDKGKLTKTGASQRGRWALKG